MSYRILLLSVLCFSTSMVKAQDTLKTHITYDLTTEAAMGTGDYTAYQLATNRHHVLGTRANTAYMRGAVNVEHQLSEDWKLAGAVDAIASVHADHKAYLQQCYELLLPKLTMYQGSMTEFIAMPFCCVP